MCKKVHRYFLDLEFREGFRRRFKYFGKRTHYIDLISIGIVDDLGRSYYGICKDFDLKEVWNSYQQEEGRKTYWMRENVLKSVWKDLYKQTSGFTKSYFPQLCDFTYGGMKTMLNWFGKSEKQIAGELRNFIYQPALQEFGSEAWSSDQCVEAWLENTEIRFYAHFCAYDWVRFCALFGSMMDIPAGFPMFCRDLEQLIHEKGIPKDQLKAYIDGQDDLHNALADAQWNRVLFKEIQFTPAMNRRLSL